MTEKEYYEIMCTTINKYKSFKKLYPLWYCCFIYAMAKRGVNRKSAHSIFYNFIMDNWDALHLENTKYANYKRNELLESFKGECCYISDRLSFDRIFRTHWLFLQVFNKDLNKIRYPNLYS